MFIIRNFKLFLKIHSIISGPAFLILLLILYFNLITIGQVFSFSLLLIIIPFFLFSFKLIYLKGFKNIRKLNELKKLLTIEKRICYRCLNPLVLEDYFLVNRQESVEYLAKIWNNPCIELICCTCYLEYEMLKEEQPQLDDFQFVN